MQEIITKRFKESVESKQALLNNTGLTILMSEMAQRMIAALRNGNKIMFCGNGGSAVDAMHLAAELSGRYYFDRKPLNAEALSADNAFLTAVANDYGYEKVFSRLLTAKENPVIFWWGFQPPATHKMLSMLLNMPGKTISLP